MRVHDERPSAPEDQGAAHDDRLAHLDAGDASPAEERHGEGTGAVGDGDMERWRAARPVPNGNIGHDAAHCHAVANLDVSNRDGRRSDEGVESDVRHESVVLSRAAAEQTA